MVEAHGCCDWRRLFGKEPGHVDHRLPGDNHVTMWRQPGDRGRKIAIWVSQLYPLSRNTLSEMACCADKFGLDYSISTWPASHFPGSVLFVEWRAREQEA